MAQLFEQLTHRPSLTRSRSQSLTVANQDAEPVSSQIKPSKASTLSKLQNTFRSLELATLQRSTSQQVMPVVNSTTEVPMLRATQVRFHNIFFLIQLNTLFTTVGGLVYGNSFGAGQQFHEWTSFISSNEFCIRACVGVRSTQLCNHIYDIMGCYWVYSFFIF